MKTIHALLFLSFSIAGAYAGLSQSGLAEAKDNDPNQRPTKSERIAACVTECQGRYSDCKYDKCSPGDSACATECENIGWLCVMACDISNP